MERHSEQFNRAQAAVADHLRKQVDARSAGASWVAPARTLRVSCSVCGSVHGKPWADKARELCKHGCYWILAGHIAWDGMRRRVKICTAAAVPLMARYRTYDRLVEAGKSLPQPGVPVRV